MTLISWLSPSMNVLSSGWRFESRVYFVSQLLFLIFPFMTSFFLHQHLSPPSTCISFPSNFLLTFLFFLFLFLFLFYF